MRTAIFLVLALALILAAQEGSAPKATSDSLKPAPVANATGTTGMAGATAPPAPAAPLATQAPQALSSNGVIDPPASRKDSLAAGVAPTGKDSLAMLHPKSRSDTVIVAKHSFDHREQIITGSVIMSCLVLMLVAMNNYNPR